MPCRLIDMFSLCAFPISCECITHGNVHLVYFFTCLLYLYRMTPECLTCIKLNFNVYVCQMYVCMFDYCCHMCSCFISWKFNKHIFFLKKRKASTSSYGAFKGTQIFFFKWVLRVLVKPLSKHVKLFTCSHETLTCSRKTHYKKKSVSL